MIRCLWHLLLAQRRRIALLLVCVVTYLTLKILTIATLDAPSHHNVRELLQQHQAIQPMHIADPYPDTPECQPSKALGLPRSLKEMNCDDECKQFECHKFLFPESGSKIFERARKWMSKHPRTPRPDVDIAKAAHANCSAFLQSEGFLLKALSAEEKNYPIAYNIIMHKDGAQFLQLLRTIYQPQNSICIHIDQKSSTDLRDMVASVVDCLDGGVFLATKQESIVYAGYSRLQADINCMHDQELGPGAAVPWQYLINTAGQAFPLKTNLEMVRVLKIYNGANDIEGIHGRRVLKSRFQNEWLEPHPSNKTGKIYKSGKKNPPVPHEIDIVRGSAYGIFSRGMVNYILTDEKAKDLLEWSRNTYSPDEHYWSTLHHTMSNPHLKTPGQYRGDPNKKPWLACYAAWGGQDPCKGKWMRGVCVFGVEDLPSLVNQDNRKEFMANKFTPDVQPLALDCLEEYIRYREKCPATFDHEYYQQLPFIKL